MAAVPLNAEVKNASRLAFIQEVKTSAFVQRRRTDSRLMWLTETTAMWPDCQFPQSQKRLG
jgi:hypothetical protein